MNNKRLNIKYICLWFLGPLYQFIKDKYKLDGTDGKIVDAIHTNTEGFGSIKNFGKVDFFANGGIGFNQGGCKDKSRLDRKLYISISDTKANAHCAFVLFNVERCILLISSNPN